MAVLLGTVTVWEEDGSPVTHTFVNNGDLMLTLMSGQNSGGATPGLVVGTYDGNALTQRGYAQRTYASAVIGDLENAPQGSASHVASGPSCDYSAWGQISLQGAKATGAYQDGATKTGDSTSPTLDSAIETAPGGIALAVCTRGQTTAIGGPDGWTNLWYETGASGGGSRAAYKLTSGAPVNPVFTLGSSYEWALSVASYYPTPGGSQGIMIWSKMQDFYDELKRGLIAPDLLQKRYGELFI